MQGNDGNAWEWVYGARGMKGTTRECKVVGVKC